MVHQMRSQIFRFQQDLFFDCLQKKHVRKYLTRQLLTIQNNLKDEFLCLSLYVPKLVLYVCLCIIFIIQQGIGNQSAAAAGLGSRSTQQAHAAQQRQRQAQQQQRRAQPPAQQQHDANKIWRNTVHHTKHKLI